MKGARNSGAPSCHESGCCRPTEGQSPGAESARSQQLDSLCAPCGRASSSGDAESSRPCSLPLRQQAGHFGCLLATGQLQEKVLQCGFCGGSGASAQGFITNVEGILNRVKKQIEVAQEDAEDPDARKKAKNHLKKLQNVLWGHDKLKIVIEDPSGNSAIVSEKATKSKL